MCIRDRFETALAGDFIKQAVVLPTRPIFYHWRSAGGAEVDLILERDGILYPCLLYTSRCV